MLLLSLLLQTCVPPAAAVTTATVAVSSTDAAVSLCWCVLKLPPFIRAATAASLPGLLLLLCWVCMPMLLLTLLLPNNRVERLQKVPRSRVAAKPLLLLLLVLLLVLVPLTACCRPARAAAILQLPAEWSSTWAHQVCTSCWCSSSSSLVAVRPSLGCSTGCTKEHLGHPAGAQQIRPAALSCRGGGRHPHLL